MLCIPLYICLPLWCCSRRVIYCFRSSKDNETGRRTKLRFLEAKAHEMKLFMLVLFTERCLGMRSIFRRFSDFFSHGDMRSVSHHHGCGETGTSYSGT